MTFLHNINKNKYEIIAVLLMVSIGLINLGWLSLKRIPETPPGYYENIVIEHTRLLTKLRSEYQNQRTEMRDELMSKKHTFLEAAQIALKLNIAESRYLDFWLAEKPIIIGMLKPFEEKKYLSWYLNLPPETQKLVKNIADNLHSIYPKLAECNQNAINDYMALVSGLTAPSEDKLSDALVAQTRVIMRNITQNKNSLSEECDSAMVSYFSSVQLLSRTYSTLADTYQVYSERNEIIRKILSTVLSFFLFVVCYKCRENLIKKAAQSLGG
ncbi:hypothetical protein [Enterobacillus tribolii]|uniref:Nitrate/nitrite sensing protein n=2 Tax=Enterobacterales TaxID=91347 RepID=A0A370QM88_9GAMM|nr:hypothetical protein [Enterobacillus tribolii]MBW7982317.1 hypothetical protein [Enterobacillus tribolii]RDK89483.1 hypothetical protein C8D90_107134 [Enterobacillus tribolii]